MPSMMIGAVHPGKINMELKNVGLEGEFPFRFFLIFRVPAVNLPGSCIVFFQRTKSVSSPHIYNSSYVDIGVALFSNLLPISTTPHLFIDSRSRAASLLLPWPSTPAKWASGHLPL